MKQKNHSLPNLKIGSIPKGSDIDMSEVFGVDREYLEQRIISEVLENYDVDDIMDTNKMEFIKGIDKTTLEIFEKLYNSFSDREFALAMWYYVDAMVKMGVLHAIK